MRSAKCHAAPPRMKPPAAAALQRTRLAPCCGSRARPPAPLLSLPHAPLTPAATARRVQLSAAAPGRRRVRSVADGVRNCATAAAGDAAPSPPPPVCGAWRTKRAMKQWWPAAAQLSCSYVSPTVFVLTLQLPRECTTADFSVDVGAGAVTFLFGRVLEARASVPPHTAAKWRLLEGGTLKLALQTEPPAGELKPFVGVLNSAWLPHEEAQLPAYFAVWCAGGAAAAAPPPRGAASAEADAAAEQRLRAALKAWAAPAGQRELLRVASATDRATTPAWELWAERDAAAAAALPASATACDAAASLAALQASFADAFRGAGLQSPETGSLGGVNSMRWGCLDTFSAVLFKSLLHAQPFERSVLSYALVDALVDRARVPGGAALLPDGTLARLPASLSLADAVAADAAEPHALYFVRMHNAEWMARYHAATDVGGMGGRLAHMATAPFALAHFLVIARAGDAGVLLQSYERQYTLAEWLTHPRKLARAEAAGPPDARLVLSARPAHRGVLSRAQLAEACAAIDRVCAAPWDAAAAKDYKELTGVRLTPEAAAEVQRAQTRLQLTWLRTPLELPEP